VSEVTRVRERIAAEFEPVEKKYLHESGYYTVMAYHTDSEKISRLVVLFEQMLAEQKVGNGS
jgi:hypothetical protein